MSIQDLIALLENRISFNQGQRAAAVQRGDIARVQELDVDINSTHSTLDQLRSLV